MKKTMSVLSLGLILSLLFILPSNQTSAQAKFGIKGGANLSNMKYEPRDATDGVPDSKSLLGYHIGLIVDLPVAEGFSVQPGLLLNSIGSKIERGGEDAGFTVKINPQYLTVPVNLLIKPRIGPGASLYLGAGPYLGFGVGGKASVKGNLGDVSGYTDHKLKFGDGADDDLKSTDIGGNLVAGLEFDSGLLIGAQYGMSFTNNAPKGENNDDKILKNKAFSVSIGFLF